MSIHTPSEGPREPECVTTEVTKKFQELLMAAKGLDDIINHLTDLKTSVGIDTQEVRDTEALKEQPKRSEPTLVSMLNDLPAEINVKVSRAHDAIDVIMQELN